MNFLGRDFLPFQPLFFVLSAFANDRREENLAEPVQGELVHVTDLGETGHYEIEQGPPGCDGEIVFARCLDFTFSFFCLADALGDFVGSNLGFSQGVYNFLVV